jgi:hypothetical protein
MTMSTIPAGSLYTQLLRVMKVSGVPIIARRTTAIVEKAPKPMEACTRLRKQSETRWSIVGAP